jgi:hypothetical protein
MISHSLPFQGKKAKETAWKKKAITARNGAKFINPKGKKKKKKRKIGKEKKNMDHSHLRPNKRIISQLRARAKIYTSSSLNEERIIAKNRRCRPGKKTHSHNPKTPLKRKKKNHRG